MNRRRERRHSCRQERPLLGRADTNVCAPCSWSQRAILRSWRLPMNRRRERRHSCRQERPLLGRADTNVCAPCSWSQRAILRSWRLPMNREVPALISNNLRTLWFMVPMHARSERRLPMNLPFRSACPRPAAAALRRASTKVRSPIRPSRLLRLIEPRSCAPCSWSQRAILRSWRLPMNREVPALISNNLRTLWFMDSMRSKKETSLSMNREVPALISNNLRTLWFMVPMHARSERRLPMNRTHKSLQINGASEIRFMAPMRVHP